MLFTDVKLLRMGTKRDLYHQHTEKIRFSGARGATGRLAPMRRYVNAGLSVREAYGAVATGGVTDPAGAITGIIQNLAALGDAVSE